MSQTREHNVFTLSIKQMSDYKSTCVSYKMFLEFIINSRNVDFLLCGAVFLVVFIIY